MNLQASILFSCAVLISACGNNYQSAPLNEELFLLAVDSREISNVEILLSRLGNEKNYINKDLKIVDNAINKGSINIAKILLENGFRIQDSGLIFRYIKQDALYPYLTKELSRFDSPSNLGEILRHFVNANDIHNFSINYEKLKSEDIAIDLISLAQSEQKIEFVKVILTDAAKKGSSKVFEHFFSNDLLSKEKSLYEIDLVDVSLDNENINLAKLLLQNGLQVKNKSHLEKYIGYDQIYEFIADEIINLEDFYNISTVLKRLYDLDDILRFGFLLDNVDDRSILSDLLMESLIDQKENFSIEILRKAFIDLEIDSTNLLSYSIIFKLSQLRDYLLSLRDEKIVNSMFFPNDGIPPIFASIISSDTVLIRDMMEHEYNGKFINYQNMTPLDFAEGLLNDDAVEILLDYKPELEKETIFFVQKILKNLGYKIKYIDGVWGNNTHAELLKFQFNNNLGTTGYPTLSTLLSLNQSQEKINRFIRLSSEWSGNKIKNYYDENNIQNIDAVDEYGWSALMHSSNIGDVETMRFLKEHGADINIKSVDGYTPLMVAAINRRDHIITYLLSEKADKSAKNKEGFTAGDLYFGNDKNIESKLGKRSIDRKKWLILFDKKDYVQNQWWNYSEDSDELNVNLKKGWDAGFRIQKMELIKDGLFTIMYKDDQSEGNQYFIKKSFDEIEKKIEEIWGDKSEWNLKGIQFWENSWIAYLSEGFEDFGVSSREQIHHGYWDFNVNKEKLNSAFLDRLQEGFNLLNIDIDSDKAIFVYGNKKQVGLADQKILVSKRFPSSEIIKLNSDGYRITEIEYSKSHLEFSWLIVMSQGTGSKIQRVYYSSDFPNEEIERMRKEGFYITDIVFTG